MSYPIDGIFDILKNIAFWNFSNDSSVLSQWFMTNVPKLYWQRQCAMLSGHFRHWTKGPSLNHVDNKGGRGSRSPKSLTTLFKDGPLDRNCWLFASLCSARTRWWHLSTKVGTKMASKMLSNSNSDKMIANKDLDVFLLCWCITFRDWYFYKKNNTNY